MASYRQSSAKMLMFYIMLFSTTYATHDLAYPVSRTLRLTRKTRQVNAISTSHIDNKRPTTIEEGFEELATHATGMSTKIDILKNAFKQKCPIYQMGQFSTEYFLSPTTYIHSDIKEMFQQCKREEFYPCREDLTFYAAVKYLDRGHFSTVRCILEMNSSNVHLRDENGDTALHWAAAQENLCIIAGLLNFGAVVNARGRNLRTPLHHAASNGRLDAIRMLIKCGADVNAIDAAGNTPLTLSMLGNHINASFNLLSDGASPNTKYENGDTLLLRALKDNRLDVTNKLLNYGASISLKGKTGESPLTLIAEKGDTEILRTMLNYAKPNDTQELARALQVAKDGVVVWVFADTVPYLFLGQPGKNALLQSTKRCREDITKSLISLGVDPNIVDENGKSPLRLATENDCTACIAILKEQGDQPLPTKKSTPQTKATNRDDGMLERWQNKTKHLEMADEDGMTPLLRALKNRNVEEAEELLRAGANPNRKSFNGWTALHYASFNCSLKALHILIPKIEELNARTDTGSTPMHIAVENNQCHCIPILSQGGVDVNSRRHDMFTPLHIASALGFSTCISALLAEKANPNLKDRNGWTPLHITAEKNHCQNIRVLIEGGADVNSTRDDMFTPLHVAAHWGFMPCITALVAAKADINARGKTGWAPIHIAAEKNQCQIIPVLAQAGAEVNARRNDMYTALHIAAHWGFTPCITALVAAKADLNARDKSGWAPIHIAAEKNQC